MAFRFHGIRQSKLVLLALVLSAAGACSVKEAGLELTAAGGAGGTATSSGTGGTVAPSGSGGQGTGGAAGDAAMGASDGGRLDGTPSTGGASGTGGIRGPDGGLDTRDGTGQETGGGSDSLTSTGGRPSTGGASGTGGSGTGGTTVPDASLDLGPDVADVRREAREGPPDRAPDRRLAEEVAPEARPDKPFVESDGSYFAEVPRSEAGPLVLAWSDEFDGEANGGVDIGRWRYVTWGPGAGAVNNEVQQYTESTSNVFLDGAGYLVIRALHNPAAANPYTSGRIETRVAFGPGHHVEVRARLPGGRGSFPAILMKGTGEWPASGALGLMEQYGQEKNWFYATAYAGDEPGSGQTEKTKYVFPDAVTASVDFHVYSLDWYIDRLVFQVDGQTVLTSDYGPSSPFATINEYLVLNVALGGDMGEDIDNEAFPMEMVVDYVRVYTL